MGQDVCAFGAPDAVRDRPFWTDLLRALREARGVTQNGWATWLGVSRKTVQRWEGGTAVPDRAAEEALVELCSRHGLFRSYSQDPLHGVTLTPALLRDFLAEARLGATPAIPASAAPAVTPARLIARAGEGRSTAHALRVPETTIGRGADNDIVVPSDHVSRYHARVRWDGRQYLVEDLGSKNGTRVNGAPVVAPRPLRHGDLVTLAGLTDLGLTFDAEGETVTVRGEALPGGGLWVDTRNAEVWLRGRALHLEPSAYHALALLYERAGDVVSAEELASCAWLDQADPVPVAVVDQLVGELRQMIEPEPAAPSLLRSESGGYRLVLAQPSQ